MKNRAILILLSILLALTACAQKENTGMVRLKDATVTDAILYTVDGRELQYNAVCAGRLSGAEINDESGNGIDSVKKLADILGTADAPAKVHTPEPGVRTLGKAITADIVTDGKGNITALTVKSVSERPVIGITWKMDAIGEDYEAFAEAFERNGAMAVYLPLVLSQEQAQQVLSQIDGLFVTGGEDWNPGLYGQERLPHGAVDCNDIRDMSDLHLIRQAIGLDVPMLCVCRGAQGLNIALGGGLIQDIPSYLGTKVLEGAVPESRVSGILSGALPSGRAGDACGCEGENHLRLQLDGLDHSKEGAYHPLATGIDKNSKWLYEIYGSESVQWVATAHHQAIDPDALGDGLTVAAVSADGIIEAVEYRANRFALGLQWHPERDALGDSGSRDVSQVLSNLPLRALVRHAASGAEVSN